MCDFNDVLDAEIEANIETMEMAKTRRVNVEDLPAIFRKAQGRRVGIVYIKKSGERRILNGSFEYKNIHEGLSTLFETNAGGYRSVIHDNILEVHADGYSFVVS